MVDTVAPVTSSPSTLVLVVTAVLTAVPLIIAALANAWLTIRNNKESFQRNKETNEKVDKVQAVTTENAHRLDGRLDALITAVEAKGVEVGMKRGIEQEQARAASVKEGIAASTPLPVAADPAAPAESVESVKPGDKVKVAVTGTKLP